jgi:hypothetical protein
MRLIIIFLLGFGIHGFAQTHLLYTLKENPFSIEKKNIMRQ